MIGRILIGYLAIGVVIELVTYAYWIIYDIDKASNASKLAFIVFPLVWLPALFFIIKQMDEQEARPAIGDRIKAISEDEQFCLFGILASIDGTYAKVIIEDGEVIKIRLDAYKVVKIKE